MAEANLKIGRMSPNLSLIEVAHPSADDLVVRHRPVYVVDLFELEFSADQLRQVYLVASQDHIHEPRQIIGDPHVAVKGPENVPVVRRRQGEREGVVVSMGGIPAWISVPRCPTTSKPALWRLGRR